jgi:hypothetical protein
LHRHRCPKPDPDENDEYLPGDPNAKAALAAKADRWWRNLPLTERLRIITAHAEGAPHAHGPHAPV